MSVDKKVRIKDLEDKIKESKRVIKNLKSQIEFRDRSLDNKIYTIGEYQQKIKLMEEKNNKQELKKVRINIIRSKNKKWQTNRVYVMIDKNTGYHKIGRSVNPHQRERTLQSEKPTIEMLFNYPATNNDEKEIHNMFKEKRIRGEWFDLNGSDLTKIRNYFKLT